jgi:hypothetical protein
MNKKIRSAFFHAAFRAAALASLAATFFSCAATTERATTTLAAAEPAAGTDTADAAVAAAKRFFDSRAKGDMKAVFLDLPESIQKEASSVLASIAGKMDAEVFAALAGIVGAFAEVGMAKPDFVKRSLYESPHRGERGPEAAEIAAFSTALKSFVGKLDFDLLNNGDVAAILASPEITAIANLWNDGGVKPEITLVQLNADGSVAMTIRDARGSVSTETHEKIEGVWMPVRVFEECKTVIAMARKAMEKLEIDEDKKAQIIAALPVVKLGVSNAKNAKTFEQCQQRMSMAMMPVMMLAVPNVEE